MTIWHIIGLFFIGSTCGSIAISIFASKKISKLQAKIWEFKNTMEQQIPDEYKYVMLDREGKERLQRLIGEEEKS